MEETFDFDSDGSLDELEIVSLEGGDGPYNVFLDYNTFKTHVDALILRKTKPYLESKGPKRPTGPSGPKGPTDPDRFYQFNTGSKTSAEELIPFTRFVANLYEIVRLKGPYEVNVRVGESFQRKIDVLLDFMRRTSQVLGFMYTKENRTLMYYFVYAIGLKESEEPVNPIEEAALVEPARPQTPPLPVLERSVTERAGEPITISYPSTPERPARRRDDVSLTLSPETFRRLGQSLEDEPERPLHSPIGQPVFESTSSSTSEDLERIQVCNSEFYFGPRSERPIHVSYFGTFRRACKRVARSED